MFNMNIEYKNNNVNVDLGTDKVNLNIGNSNKMVRGPRGYSSYELAIQNGFIGTEQEYLLSLKGEKATINGRQAINIVGKDEISVTQQDNNVYIDAELENIGNSAIDELLNRIF